MPHAGAVRAPDFVAQSKVDEEEFGSISGVRQARLGFNYAITAEAIVVCIESAGLLCAAAIAGSAESWSGFYEDCGPPNYGM